MKTNSDDQAVLTLTKREHFAVQCLQGLLASPEPPANPSLEAVMHADELVKMLNEPIKAE